MYFFTWKFFYLSVVLLNPVRTMFHQIRSFSSSILSIKVLMMNKSLYYKGFLMIQNDIVKFIFSPINDKKRKKPRTVEKFYSLFP